MSAPEGAQNFDFLKAMLSRYENLPIKEWLKFIPLIRFRRLKEGEFFFRQNSECSTIGIVIYGLFKIYNENSEGLPRVLTFRQKGQAIASVTSYLTGCPSKYSGEALENSLVATIQYSSLLKLAETSIYWERFLRRGLAETVIEKENREYDIFVLTAEQRYLKFVEQSPELSERLPLYLVASYLGINPVSLSRIRRRLQTPE